MRRIIIVSRILTIAVLFAFAADISAEIKLPGIFGPGMVLQRDQPVPVWGWADGGETVTVEFAGQKKSTAADKDGKWMVKLDPMPTSVEPRQLIVRSSINNPQSTIGNVLVGEVWLYAGEYSGLVGNALQPDAEAASANYPELRFCTISGGPQDVPADDAKASWSACTPAGARSLAAIGFFFARDLFKALDVPVGVISSQQQNAPAEPWIPPDGFRAVPELKAISDMVDTWDIATEAGQGSYREFFASLDQWLAEAEKAVAERKSVSAATLPDPPGKGKSVKTPTSLFNGQIHPIVPYAIRGVLWREVAANDQGRETYYFQMQALIGSWRALWKQGDFPFYFVQLPNYLEPDHGDPAGGGDWAAMREAQRQLLGITNVGMAVTIDIGDAKARNSANKQDVGKRLALLALARTYGKNIVYSGPLYKSHKVEGGKIRIAFDSCGSGLVFGEKNGLKPVKETKDARIQWIAIAGRDKQWQWADAAVDGDTIVVSSDKVPEPVAARYAYTMNPDGVLLYNKEGLPASPFKTDTW